MSIEKIWIEWLGREWDKTNEYYRLKLSRPQIALGDWDTKHGEWDAVSRTITIRRATIQHYPWHVVIDILKHEMAHQFVSHYSPGLDTSHGIYFKKACEKMALPDWAVSATGELPKDIPDWRNTSLTEEEARLLEKTNKLLALAQSENEHEASLAAQKVRELYTKYNLDQVELRRDAKFVSWILNFKKKRIESWQSIILVILDRHFFVRAISFREFDASAQVEFCAAEIIGKKQNVLMAEYVYQFLERTIHSLWEKHLTETPKLQRMAPPTRKSEKRHFFIGVLDGFMKQLDETNAYQNLERSEKESKALIQVADQELSEHYRKKYPRVSKRSGSGFNPERDTYKTGVSEGKKIRLRKTMSGHDGSRGKLLTS